jgi:hypothetical protein
MRAPCGELDLQALVSERASVALEAIAGERVLEPPGASREVIPRQAHAAVDRLVGEVTTMIRRRSFIVQVQARSVG